jgi:tRNA 2-selenouridine synthase
MPAQRIHIEEFLQLATHHPIIDVRSPAEYAHAHIPGAHSLPLFTDEERKVVGTTYKQQSREAAIKIGLDYFGPKMRQIVDSVEEIIRNGQRAISNEQSSVHNNDGTTNGKQLLPVANCILVYCWRGGMRSGAISWLLDMYGFKVYTLIGGYKKFRNYVLDTFKEPFSLRIVGGYTGSGKTELLSALKEKGESIIDLEDIAKHKGSAFGNIGMPEQPSQEMFENILAQKLNEVKSQKLKLFNSTTNALSFTYPIWLEDESQRIGHINIPNDFWKTMRSSPVYFLDIPFEERLKHLVEEYGQLDQQRMIDAITRISEKLGGQNARQAIQLLQEGNTLESFRILLKYYDKFYLKGLHNREAVNSLLHSIECKSVTSENALQLIREKDLLQKH